MAQQQGKQNNKKDSLKDYVEVNVRVERFHEKYPYGRIHTEIVSWKDEIVVMKAEVYRDIKDEFPAATGHAYEKEGSSFINKTSALENCETSAVGRALALLGFEIKKSIASKEEVENAKLNQNNQNNNQTSKTSGPITSEQVGIIKTKALEFAKARKKTDKDVYEALKIDNIENLSSNQASLIIAKLDAWLANVKQGA